MSRLNDAIKALDRGEHPGLAALHEVRRAADVSIALARLECALLTKAVSDGNEPEARRLIKSLARQVYGGDVMIVRVVCSGGGS